jgi:hypothetical protein
MEYLAGKYILEGIEKGDVKYIAESVININTGNYYGYNFTRRVLQGEIKGAELRKNHPIILFAKKYLKMKKKLREQAKAMYYEQQQ